MTGKFQLSCCLSFFRTDLEWTRPSSHLATSQVCIPQVRGTSNHSWCLAILWLYHRSDVGQSETISLPGSGYPSRRFPHDCWFLVSGILRFYPSWLQKPRQQLRSCFPRIMLSHRFLHSPKRLIDNTLLILLILLVLLRRRANRDLFISSLEGSHRQSCEFTQWHPEF